MFDYQESFDWCKAVFERKLGKEYKDFSVLEKAILANIIADKALGRMSCFLSWDSESRNSFLKWLEGNNICYSELSDAERWAYEDAFGR